MENPFFNRGPIRDPRFYLPQPRETREVVRLINQSQNCSLMGPIKSGKTSLLLHLARCARAQAAKASSGTLGSLARSPSLEKGDGVTADGLQWEPEQTPHSLVYLSFEGLGRVSQEGFFHHMIRETFRQSVARTEGDNPHRSSIALIWPRFERRDEIPFLELREALDQLEAAGERLVFLLDEVDMAAHNLAFDLNFFSALRHIAARPEVCFVTATSCPLHKIEIAGREIGSPFADLFSVVRLRPPEMAEAWEWVRSLALDEGVNIESEREFISSLGRGSPYHLQVIAHEVFDCKASLPDGHYQRGEIQGRSDSALEQASEPLTEDELVFIASSAYEQVEPILATMWERLDSDERTAVLAAIGSQEEAADEETGGRFTPPGIESSFFEHQRKRETANIEVCGFTTLVNGQATVVDGLVERFIWQRFRDRGSVSMAVFDSLGPSYEGRGKLDRAAMFGMVRMLMRAVEARDRYSRGHSYLVARLGAAIAQEMGCTTETVEAIRLASRVHDVGRVSISDMILLKPGPLNEVEMQIIRTHPVVGAQILDALEFPWAIKPAVRYHHERLDGSGYPEGLIGDEIPLTARIVAVADVMAAMTADKPYQTAVSEQEALAELMANAGAKYDPAAVAALARVVERGQA